MTIPPISLGITKGAEWLKALNAEMFTYGQAHGYMNKSADHTSVHALAGRLQAGPSGNLELTVPSSLIKGVFDALDEPGAEFVVRNNRTECAIKVMTKEEVDKLGGTSHITERGHSYHYTLGPIVELPATGEYEKLWAISIKSDDLESIRRSYGLETSPQLGFYIPVGCKKKKVTEDNKVSKLASHHEYIANDPNMRILSQGPVTDRDFLYHASGKKFDSLDPSYNSKKSFGHEYNAPVVFAGDSPSSAFAANPTAEYQAVKDKIKNSVYHRLIDEQTGRKALLGHTPGGYLYKLPASAFTKIDREDNELGKWNKSTEYVSHMPVKPISVTPMQSTDVDAIPEYEYLGEDFVGEMPAQHYLNHAKDPKVIAAIKDWLGSKQEKLAGVYTASGEKVQGVGLRKMYHSLLEEQGLPGLGVNNEDTGDVELSFDGDEAKRQEVFDQLSSRVQAKTGHPVTFAPVDIPQSSVPVSLSNKETERLNAIHHLAYRMSNMYDPADPLLDSNDNFKQKLADRFRLQISPRGLKGTVPSRAAEQLLGTRPMYEGMMPARRTRSEEEALSDMAEEQKLRLMKALKGGRGFLAPNESGVSKLASLLKSAGETFKYSDKVGVDPEPKPKREVPALVPVPPTPKLAPTAPKPSITGTSFSPLQPSNAGTPEFHPGPNYERGDYQRQLQGQPNASKYKPLPEEAPLGNTSMDFSYLTPAFLGKSLSSLWGHSNLKAVKAMPSVKYGLPALGVTSAVAAAIPGIKTTYDAIARAPQDILDTIYRGAGFPRIGKYSRRSSADTGTLLGKGTGDSLGTGPRAEDIKFPELKEVPFSIIGKDNATVSFARDLGWDVTKQVLSNALHQGLNAYSTSKEGPKGPFAFTPSAQLSDAAARAAAAAADEYTNKEGPDYAKSYQRHVNKFLGIDEGQTALDTSGLSDPLLSQGNKDRLNTLSAIRRLPMPFELKGNPHFLKEVMDKYTPNLGEAAWDLVFKGREDAAKLRENAADAAAFKARLKDKNFITETGKGAIKGDEMGNTAGRPLPSPDDKSKIPRANPIDPVEQPWLRKEMSEGASRLGKGISDSLVPPRPKGQQPPAMFPQIRKLIEDLGDAAMKTNKSAGITEGGDTPSPVKPAEPLPVNKLPSMQPDPAPLDTYPGNPMDMPLYTLPSGAKQLGHIKNTGLVPPANANWDSGAGYSKGVLESPGASSGPGVFTFSSHGGGYPGSYRLSNPGNHQIYLDDMPRLLRGQNPSTVMSSACNLEGGCDPSVYARAFAGANPGNKSNLKNVAMVPPGKLGLGTVSLFKGYEPELGSVGAPYFTSLIGKLKGGGAPLNDYSLREGGDPTNKDDWKNNGIYTKGRQSMPIFGLPGEAIEAGTHFYRGGNFKQLLDNTEQINTNPDATEMQKFYSTNARLGSSAAVAATRSIPEIIGSLGWNNHLRAMQDRSERKLSKTPAVQTPGLYPGVPIN